MCYPTAFYFAWLLVFAGYWFIILTRKTHHRGARISAVLLSISVIPVVWFGIQEVPAGGYSTSHFLLVAALMFALSITAVVAFSLQISSTTNERARLQLQYIALAFLLPLAFNIIFSVAQPAVRGIELGRTVLPNSPIDNFGPALTMVLASTIAYAILRHRLLGIRITVKRRLVRYSLYSMAVFVGTVGIAILVTQLTFTLPTMFVLIGSCIVGSFLIKYCIDRIMTMCIKKDIIDLCARMEYELAFLENDENPKQFLAAALQLLQKHFSVQDLQFITYEHASNSLYLVPDEDLATPNQHFSLTEPWVRAVRYSNQILHRTEVPLKDFDNSAQQQLIAMFERFHGDYLVPLRQNHQLLGMLFIQIEPQALYREDQVVLQELQKLLEQMYQRSFTVHTSIAEYVDNGMPNHT